MILLAVLTSITAWISLIIDARYTDLLLLKLCHSNHYSMVPMALIPHHYWLRHYLRKDIIFEVRCIIAVSTQPSLYENRTLYFPFSRLRFRLLGHISKCFYSARSGGAGRPKQTLSDDARVVVLRLVRQHFDRFKLANRPLGLALHLTN